MQKSEHEAYFKRSGNNLPTTDNRLMNKLMRNYIDENPRNIIMIEKMFAGAIIQYKFGRCDFIRYL